MRRGCHEAVKRGFAWGSPARPPVAPRRGRWSAALCGMIGALCCGTPALAAQVFHSPNDDGQPSAGPPEVPEGGVQSAFLYIDGGALASAAGTACDTGAGDEVCGYTLTLTGLGGLTLTGFLPDDGANLLHDTTALELRVNGLDTGAPTPGPQRIGRLLFTTVAGSTLELSSGEAVGADLSSEILPVAEIITVPEPAMWLQLASATALLAGLGRRRARR
jgi:hypothetical protein